MQGDRTAGALRRRRSTRHCRGLLASITVVGLAVVLALPTTAAAGPRKQQSPQGSRTLTVLEGAAFAGNWPNGLDPATNLSALANGTLMDAIYGELFQIGANNKLIYDLATGYRFTNSATRLLIHLRTGVLFSNGAPLTSQAVAFNFRRDLAGQSVAKPAWPPVASITTPTATTIVIHFKAPDGAAVNQFQDSNVNWIASPSAIKKLGAKHFELYPVGAGPFRVVSDTLNSKLVLKRNVRYWQKGKPHLEGLVFETVASDQAALEDLRSGSAQAYEDMTTPRLLPAFRSAGFTATMDPGTAPADVLVNTSIPPFTSLKAREALYFATNQRALDRSIFNGTCPLTESFTGPGGLFYRPSVAGYRSYNPAKARRLVKQLGGIDFTLFYTPLQDYVQSEAIALQTMYQSVGMKVTLLKESDLAADIQELSTHKWQATTANLGSWDPAGATGPAFRLQAGGLFSGVNDPHLDALLTAAAAAVSPAVRARDYSAIAAYLNKQAYTPFICTPASWDIAAKGVHGPGLTTVTAGSSSGPLVLWQDVAYTGTPHHA